MNRQWVLTLPWTTPPLTLNGRQHHMAKARIVREIRNAAHFLARMERVPPLAACEVLLTYHPRDSRRRDADNLVATLKACCDGLVDAHVVSDDTPDLMRKHMPVIGAVERPARLTLTITEINPEEDR